MSLLGQSDKRNTTKRIKSLEALDKDLAAINKSPSIHFRYLKNDAVRITLRHPSTSDFDLCLRCAMRLFSDAACCAVTLVSE